MNCHKQRNIRSERCRSLISISMKSESGCLICLQHESGPTVRVLHFLSKSRTIAGFKVKKGKERGPCLVNDLFMEPRKSSPLKWYFSWVLTLQSSSSLGIYVSLVHVFFSGFHYYMTQSSPQSTLPRSQRGCPSSENFAAPNFRINALSCWKTWVASSLEEGPPHPRKRP